MVRFIHITFPTKKKNKHDIYRTSADYQELGDARCFVLPETQRQLRHKHHVVTDGCIVEDLITGETYRCFKVLIPELRPKRPIMQVVKL